MCLLALLVLLTWGETKSGLHLNTWLTNLGWWPKGTAHLMFVCDQVILMRSYTFCHLPLYPSPHPPSKLSTVPPNPFLNFWLLASRLMACTHPHSLNLILIFWPAILPALHLKGSHSIIIFKRQSIHTPQGLQCNKPNTEWKRRRGWSGWSRYQDRLQCSYNNQLGFQLFRERRMEWPCFPSLSLLCSPIKWLLLVSAEGEKGWKTGGLTVKPMEWPYFPSFPLP